MERLAHIATVSGVQFVNEKARRSFESAWRLSSTGLLEAFRLIFGLLAQLVEHATDNRDVGGSNPPPTTKFGSVCKWPKQAGCNPVPVDPVR